jgi:copper oxidase (laccase) domain-containing protein
MDSAFLENLNHGCFETRTKRPDMELLKVKQVHGVDIVNKESLPCEADGLMVLWKDLDRPVAIKTADCMPIIIEGDKGIVFVHAGWRGLRDGIIKRPELSMISPQRVMIGPCIHECCFEVSDDFEENFKGSPFFTRQQGRLHFNLTLEAKRQILDSFPGLLVEIAPICTCCNLAFHSYRRNKTTERNWNLYIKG